MAKTILIVENNAADRAVLRAFVDKNYTVEEAESGTILLSRLRRKKGAALSAILLNLALGDMDGFEAIRRIRSSAVYKQVPVIALCTQSDKDTQAKALSSGATGFLPLPCSKELLLPLLENTILLHENAAPASTPSPAFLSADALPEEIQASGGDLTAARLKTLFEDINGGVSVVVYGDDGTLRLAYANPRYYQLFGYTKTQFEKELKKHYETVHPDDRESVLASINAVKKTKQSATFRYRILKRDNSIAHVRCNVSVTTLVGISGYLLVSILTDITEAVQTEQQAIVFGKRLEAIMKNMKSGVTAAVVKSDGTLEILFTNDLHHEMLGYTKEEYLKEVPDPLQTVHPDDLPAVRKAISSLKHIGEETEVRYRVFTKNKTIKTLHMHITMMSFPDADGPVQLAVHTDITDIVEAQEKLAAQHTRILELLNDTPSGIAIVELDPNNISATLRTLYYNDRFIAFSGFGRAEYDTMLQSDGMAFFFREDIPALIRAAKKICAGGIGTSADTLVRCHRKDGGFCWLLLTGQFAERRGDLCVLNLAVIDITERQEAADRQRISEEILRIAAETDQRSMIVYNIKTNACRAESRTLFSAKYGQVFENIPQSLLDMGLAAPESEADLCALFERIRNGEKKICVSLQLRSGPDQYEWFECNTSTVFDRAGRPDHAILVFHNITEQRVKEAVFKKWQQSIASRPPRSYTLFRINLSKGASLDNQEGELLQVSVPPAVMAFNDIAKFYAKERIHPDDRDAYTKLLDSDLLLAMFYRGEHFAELDYREVSSAGKDQWRRLTIEMVEYPNSTEVQAFLMYEDIDKAKKAELAALELAKSDPLTGALNRAAFAEAVDQDIQKNPTLPCALLILDMDGFKQINDTFGHAAGDEALQEVTNTLRTFTRSGDLICRLGGDEFLVWLRDVPYDAAIAKIAQQLCKHIRKAYNKSVLLSASAGIAVYPRDGQSYTDLYPNADKALYSMKQAGKGSYAFFSALTKNGEEALPQALPEDGQPIYSARTAKRRLLIVDDNEFNRVMLENIFKDEYLIETAKNGTEALILLRHFGSSVSVVLLDLVMPDMDGFAVLNKMQEDDNLRMIPAIVVTSDENHDTLLRAFDLGAAEYVLKPVDVDVIRMRVKSVIGKAENERLRAQNSYLLLQRDEEVKYHTVLESTGTVVVEYDWRNHVYVYDNEISKHIAGTFNHRGLWQIFLSDMIAESADVKLLQDTLITLGSTRGLARDTKLVKLKTPNGEKHWFRTSFYKSVDDFGLAEKLIITFNDVHEEVLANDKLLFQATRDELTGLYNRPGFIEKATELIAAKKPGYYMMSCMDVEKFKVINDRYGTDRGDEVLRHIARTVNGFIEKNGGLCCRHASDKFGVLFPAKLLNTEELAENHRFVAAPPCLPRPLRIRIGRWLVSDTTIPVSAMFDRASMAEALAKERYNTDVVEYDESMRDNILKEQQLTNDMVIALQNSEFVPWLQPQYNHATGALIGAEALVRWQKDGKIIPPDSFIPLFEKNGFIYEVDQSIWRQVCALLRRLLDEGKNPPPISVNISRHDMLQESFLGVLTGLVKEYRLPVELLRLEITESAFSADTKVITDMATALVSAGFTVEIDDFGSGYSSLNTLKDVPASILKLDMRFFERTGDAKRGGNIVESIVRMAKWLGMAVIAEGVEDKQQADYLKSIGCFYIQGYFYAKPMPVQDYEKRLDSSPTETKLAQLQTLQNLDNNDFWDAHSMDTLIFNSYVGAACILELNGDKLEMLRATDPFTHMLCGDALSIKDVLDIDWMEHMDQHNLTSFRDAVAESLETKETVTRQFEFHDLPGCPETVILRSSLRVIASAGKRHLIYCLNDNITAQRAAEREAFLSAERISAVMDHSNCGISAAVLHPDGRVELLFVNNRFFELLGYTRAQYEAEVKSPYDRVVPEDREKVFRLSTSLSEIGSNASIEVRQMRRDGSVVWLRCDVSVVQFANVSAPVQLSSFLDISEQKENEAKQQESARQLEVIMNNINGGIAAVYLEKDKPRYAFANEQYYSILGYTREEFEKKISTPFDLIHPDDREAAKKALPEMQEEGKRYTAEYRIVRADGSVRNILRHTSVVHFAGVDAPVQLAVISDITDLREAQRQEIATQAKLSTVMNAMSDGMTAVVFRENGPEFLFANDRYYDMHGIRRGDIGKNHLPDALNLILPEYREAVRDAIQKALQTMSTVSTEYQIQRPDGTVRWVRTVINMARLADIDGPVQVAVLSDITEEKKASDQIRFLNESAREILAQPDSEKALNNTLQNLLHYFAGERTYIFELHDGAKTSDNTYEFCAPGVHPEIERLQNVPYDTQQCWFDAFEKTGFVSIPDIAAITNENEIAMRDLLLVQNIHSIIVAPLRRDGKLIGYLGVDNPTAALDQVSQLIGLADYIAVLLTRRDLVKSIEYGRKSAQQLIDDTPGGFLRLRVLPDNTPLIVSFNTGFCRMLGLSREEIMAKYGNDAHRSVVPQDLKLVRDATREALAKNGVYTYKCRLKKKDGSPLWVQVFGRFVRDANGELFRNAFFTDITKKVEEEENQKALLDNLPFGAALYEFDGPLLTVTHINRQYWTLVGRKPTKYDKTSVTDAIHPDDRALALQEIQAAVRQGRNAAVDLRILNGDGDYSLFHVTASIGRPNNGKYQLFVAYSPISDETISLRELLPIALSTMVSASRDISYVKDKELRYICASPAFAELAGAQSPRDLIGKTCSDLLGKKRAAKFDRDDRHVLETGEAMTGVLEHLSAADGNIRLVQTSKFPILNAAGHAVGIYCVSRDVTMQTEKESRLQLLTDTIPGGIATFRCSPDAFETIYFSDGVCALAGYSREEYDASPLPLLDLIFDEDRPLLHEQLELLQRGKKSFNILFRIHTKNGGYKWINNAATITDRQGDLFLMNAVLTDVTDQQEEKENLRLAEEEYRIATEHSSRTICRYDIAENSLKVAHKAAKRLALPAVVRGVPYKQVEKGIISPDTADNYIAFYEKLLFGEKDSAAVFCIKLNDQWRWLSARGTSVFDSRGKPLSAIISFTDITDAQEKELVYKKWEQSLTERKPNQFTLFRCNLNKDSSYDTKEGALFDFAPEHADEKRFDECTAEFCDRFVLEDDRGKYQTFLASNRLLADYARGIRSGELVFRARFKENDVRWVRLSLELLQYPDSTDIEAYLMYEDINDTVLEELQIKKLAETDSLTGLQNRKFFIERVSALIDQKSASLRALFLLDIDFFKQINDSFGHGVGDESIVRMANVILSVVGKEGLVCRLGGDEFLVYLPDMPDKTAIENKARELCEAAHITIQNALQISVSIGVALLEKKGEDFDAIYHKADKALYHVKGHGKNNFAFYEPDMERDDGEVISDVTSGSLALLANGKRTLLVVDDSPINRMVTGGLFKHDFSIAEAENGQVALEYLQEHGADVALVLLDIMMPVMGGYELLAIMKSSPNLQEIPVIVISGEDDRKASLRAIKAGASEYITKPVDAELLRLRASSALSKADNGRLRKQNSDFAIDNQELSSYRSLMDNNATLLVEYNPGTGIFKYAPKTGSYLRGTFDKRPLWQIFAEDKVASDADVEALRMLIAKTDKQKRQPFSLVTPDGSAHTFLVNAFKRGVSENDSLVLITFTDRGPLA